MNEPQKEGGRKRPVRRTAAPDPIAAGLKRLWADVEAEPVPDSFLDLLDRFDDARGAGGPVARGTGDRTP